MTDISSVDAFVYEQRYLSLMTAMRLGYSIGDEKMLGSCPVCEAGQFVVDGATETYHCEACGSAGTALDLMVALEAFPTVTAARTGVANFMARGVSLLDAIRPDVSAVLERVESAPQPWEKFDLSSAGTPLVPMIPGYLGQGEFAQLIAKSGAGKSTMAAEICRCLLHRTPFLGVDPVASPLRIGWLHFDSAMQRLGEMVARFPGLERDPRFVAFRGHSGHYLDEGEGVGNVERLIRNNGLRLLVIDALASGITGDENATQEMGKLAYGLMSVAASTGCTILLLRHVGKVDMGNDGRGSTNLRGAADRMLKLKASRRGVMTLTVEKEREGYRPDPVEFVHELQLDGSLRFVTRGGAKRPEPSPASGPSVPTNEDLRAYREAHPGVSANKALKHFGGNRSAFMAAWKASAG